MLTEPASAAVSDPKTGQADGEQLLSVRDLHVEFRTRLGTAKAVNGVDLTLARSETLSILGESGSGKTVTSLCIAGLLGSGNAHVTRGSVRYLDRDLLSVGEREWRRIRGCDIAMVFQDALSSLNPVFTVGNQIAEMYRVHEGASVGEARRKAIEAMERVEIPHAPRRYHSFPHELSGGMRQRATVAIAIALNPTVLIADEPTTALDVTVQAQILELLKHIQAETGMGIILITHDVGVVYEIADRVAVMYAGRIVETGPAPEVLSKPAHPYTAGLLTSVPRLSGKADRLTPIAGSPPSPLQVPSGCAFHPRCPQATGLCETERPEMRTVIEGRASACHYAAEVFGE